MSREYAIAVALVVGGILKAFGIEIDNNALEGIIFGGAALIIAILRHSRGDINVLGARIK